jgi:hypothetical protein
MTPLKKSSFKDKVNEIGIAATNALFYVKFKMIREFVLS